ncbi:MAG: hypothetical protein ACREUC_14780, partial [Steroidobacteraceae bacterium]
MASNPYNDPTLEAVVGQKYQHGFVTDVEADTVPPGLDEDVIRLISRKKNEPQFMLEWRLKAYRHWLTMREPRWAHLRIAPIDYQSISYYSAPKARTDGPKSLDEVDPKLLATYEKLGVPLHERARLAGVAVDAVFDSVSVATTFKKKLGIPLRERDLLSGVAVDAVFDSVSVATTFKEKLGKMGIIFCSFGEAIREHGELVRKYMGSVVPMNDNFFAALNSAVFT